jgi:Domain of unknown function (DUF4440)
VQVVDVYPGEILIAAALYGSLAVLGRKIFPARDKPESERDMNMDSIGGASQDREHLRKILIVREHARADAWLRRDRRALDALLAPDFVEINSLGRFGKAELLDRLFPSLTLHEFTMEEPVIRTLSKNTAVISYRCHEAFTVNGRRTEGTFSVDATYAIDNNQYRLAMWQISPVA